MRRAHFGHARELLLQALTNQRENWWAVRDSNFLPSSLLSKLLNYRSAIYAQLAKYATGRHVLGTRLPFANPRIDPLNPQRSSLRASSISQLAGTYFQRSCGYFRRLPHRRIVDKRLPRYSKILLSFPATVVTVLVRFTVTFYVSLGHSFSLRKLCVAHTRAKGAFHENSSGFSLCLRSVQPSRVYACCHAQPCVRSRAGASRRTTSVPPALWYPQGTHSPTGQASQEVARPQGASVRGRLAH